MATQDFVPQDSTTFTPIRYYTSLDPYYYVVDNRPLQDIETNLHSVGQGGGDAARRAAVLGALSTSPLLARTFTTSTALTGFSGLVPTQISSSVLQIGPGAIFDTRAISLTIPQVVVKTALLTQSPTFNITSPISVGTSIVYTVEGTFVELTNASMASSHLPYVDAANTYLPSTLMGGELQLSLNAGLPATTGSQVPPVTTVGKIPLYNITIAQGASTFSISLHQNAPYYRGINREARPYTYSGGATAAVTNGINMFTCVAGSVTGVILPLTLAETSINPYNPIKVKITFNPTATGGNAVFRLRYKGFATGELTSVTGTTSGLDIIPVNVVANGVQSFTTTLAAVANTEFAGFVSGVWTINKEYLNITLERVGGNASDTNTGSINIMSVTFTQ